jgi:alcohol dehydrogenase YqhD (iron-dependent ADH family)
LFPVTINQVISTGSALLNTGILIIWRCNMENFVFQNPTKIIFGKGTENSVGDEICSYSKKILFLHYGDGIIKETGLHERIVSSLKGAGVEFFELTGVRPNPRLSLVYEGIKICRENGINFILAVGGGSVIDSAKAISIGVPYSGDVWDFFARKAVPEKALPIGTVLTIPATGSESSPSCIITKEEGWHKRDVYTTLIFPKFSILNPELAFTLPKNQIANGVSDIISHVLERYFTTALNVELTDRLCEAVLKTVINNSPVVLEQPDNYQAWAEIMWSGTIAHNNLLNTGRTGDWASHDIEHVLSGIYDVAHGAGLAIVLPAWMKYVYKHDIKRFSQYAARVWNVDYSFWTPEKTVLEGIERLESFYKSIGLPTKLGELGIPADGLEGVADRCTDSDKMKVGNFVKLGKSDVLDILKLAL